MSHDSPLDEKGNLVVPAACGDPEAQLPAWYVTNPWTNRAAIASAAFIRTARE